MDCMSSLIFLNLRLRSAAGMPCQIIWRAALVIEDCENLRSLPTLPQSLLHFKLSGCDSQFMRSCGMGGHKNRAMIQHVRTIIIEWKTPPGAELPDSLQTQANNLERRPKTAILGRDKPGYLLARSPFLLLLLLLLFWLYTALGARLLIALFFVLFFWPFQF